MKKRTKKEIRETLRCERSMNRVTDALILDAVEELNNLNKECKGAFSWSIKEIVNMAYDLQ